MIEISSEQLCLAEVMRSQRVGWRKVADVLGVDRDVIRYRLDPVYAEKHRARSRKSVATRGRPTLRTTEAQAIALKDTVPADTRGLTAIICGDPLPGRSALDLKNSPTSPQLPLQYAKTWELVEDRHSNLEAVD